MTESTVAARPSDWLLAWLSARGRASRPTVERACRAIAKRFDPLIRNDRSPTDRYVAPLRRMGNLEAVRGGFAVVPTTHCWTRLSDRGMFIGARDEVLRDELRRRLGLCFVVTLPDAPWCTTWGVVGESEAVAAALAGLKVAVVDEPGMRLLASLPTLEDAIAAWPVSDPPSAFSSREVAVDPRRGQWEPAVEKFVVDGLVRCTDRRPRAWQIERGGVRRLLESPEQRSVAWWAELARTMPARRPRRSSFGHDPPPS